MIGEARRIQGERPPWDRALSSWTDVNLPPVAPFSVGTERGERRCYLMSNVRCTSKGPPRVQRKDGDGWRLLILLPVGSERLAEDQGS